MHFLLVLFLVLTQQVFGQTAATALPDLPKDPGELLAMAAPFYDFNDAALKPWHLKATYQLYDQNGKPSKQGTYEYWWASPKVYRSTWTRPGAMHTDWYTADGKHFSQIYGDEFNYFEKHLQSGLLSPLPDTANLDPAKNHLERKELSLTGGLKLPCISLTPNKAPRDRPLGTFATYCLDPKIVALRISYSFGELATQYNNIAKFQGRFLARDISVFAGKQKLFSASVDTINELPAVDPAFTPAPDAAVTTVASLSSGVTVGMLVKKQAPVYPEDAKARREQGTVIMQANIGVNGKIRYLSVIHAPSDSLAASAMEAVSHWEYKPYIVNGEPVEVETVVNVIFVLGG